MKVHEKHVEHITAKLENKKIMSIKRLKKLPKKISYITWSLGDEVESDYSYEVKTNTDEIYYFMIITFFNLFILQSKMFKEQTIP